MQMALQNSRVPLWIQKKPKTKKKTTTKNNNLTDNRKWRFIDETKYPVKHKVISILVIEKIVPGKVHENDFLSKWKLILRYKDIRQLSSGSDFTLPTVLGGAIFSCNANFCVNLFFFFLNWNRNYLFIRKLYEVMNFPYCAFSVHT